MTAIQAMKKRIRELQSKMALCVSEEGYIYNDCKYLYQVLVEEVRKFQESIEWMEKNIYAK